MFQTHGGIKMATMVTSNNGNNINLLHPGKLHSINFDQNDKRYFQLQLDDADEPELNSMRYDAVLICANEDSMSYISFRLPAKLFTNPVNETDSQNCKEYVSTKTES